MKKEMILGSAGVLWGDELFFSAKEYNALLKTNIVTKETVYLCKFEKETDSNCLFRKAYLFNDEAWFLPWKAKHIVCVKINTLEMICYDIPYKNYSHIGKEIEKCAYLSSGVFNEYYIYLVPTAYDTPIIINMRNKEVMPLYDYLDVSEQAYGYGLVVGNVFWLSPHTGKELVLIDLMNKKQKKLEWIYSSLEYRGMTLWEDKIWFSPGTDVECILYYDLVTSKWGQISLEDEFFRNNCYNECFSLGDYLIFLPSSSDRILYVKNKNGKYELDSIIYEGGKLVGMRRFFSQGKTVFLGDELNCVIWKIESDPDIQLKNIGVNICDDEYAKILLNQNMQIIAENELLNLNRYLKQL